MLAYLLKKILPARFHLLLIENWDQRGLKKYTQNTNWLIGSRLVSFSTSFLTIALVARYLGPENLGKINYAQSFVAIFSAFAALGISEILYRDLVESPENQYKIIGTAVTAKIIFGILAFFAAVGLSVFLQDEMLLTILIAMAAFSFVLGPLSTVNILCKARVEAKYVSHITIFLAFFIPALKMLIIYFDKGILYFASLLMLETAIVACWSLYVYVYLYKLSPLQWRFDFSIFKKMMHDAWPFLFAGVFAYIYARIDQVMLQHFLDSTAVGLYSSAVTLTNLWLFIPGMIIASVFPALINARKQSRTRYLKRYTLLVFLILTTSLGISGMLFLLAKPVTLIVFGNSFIEAIPTLKIYVWSGTLAMMGILAQRYLIAENKGFVYLPLTVAGACLNVALNIYLIPLYGMTGAACATLVSYAIVPLGLIALPSFRTDIRLLFTDRKLEK